jgi:hypothetical protein
MHLDPRVDLLSQWPTGLSHSYLLIARRRQETSRNPALHLQVPRKIISVFFLISDVRKRPRACHWSVVRYIDDWRVGGLTLPRSLFPGLSAMPLHVSQTPARPSTDFLDSSRATAPCHSSFAVPNPILKRVYLSERIHALPILQPLCFNGLPSNGRGVLQGVPPGAPIFRPPPAPTARHPGRPHPRFVTSLHLCFITSISPVQSLHFHRGEK